VERGFKTLMIEREFGLFSIRKDYIGEGKAHMEQPTRGVG